ncbi:hypothetical protein MMC30_004705 [Trapelia coarctata]|nr:hypothetical protein [Trapelia coarctata]
MALNRDALTERNLPKMTLSDGSSASMTGPPPPMPDHLDAAGRAAARFEVKGNAIITGGTGTLALECARAPLEHGLNGLALFDLNSCQHWPSIELLRDDFPTSKIITKTVDVTDADAVAAATAESAEELNGINILCCFAGIVGCTHAIDIHMISQQTGGSILLIASISGHLVNYPQPQVAYNVSKASLLHMSRCLAAEWACYGIRVNTISPGYMDTILNEGPGLEEARNVWASRNPMGRMGSPRELTGPVVLLCSAAGSYMNGVDLVVDGGATVF